MDLANISTASTLAFALQLSLGGVFAVAAVSKLRNRSAFVDAVIAYDVVSPGTGQFVAPLIIATELFLAISFLTGWLVAAALPVSLAVLGAFFVAVALNLRRGREIPCACFGSQGERISWRSLARLAELFIAASALLALEITGARLVTLTELLRGDGAAAYVVYALGVSAFLVLSAMWSLHVREITAIIRQRASFPSREGEHDVTI